MTDAEARLKVAEEIFKRTPQPVLLDDLSISCIDKGREYGAERRMNTRTGSMGDGIEIASADNIIDCVLLARQKLAAEREAAMTPEVRKLKIALTAITRINEKSYDYFGCFRDAVNIARKALEDS